MGSAKDKVKGKANEVAGKVTGNRSKQARGKIQQGKGKVQDELEAEKERTREDVRRVTKR